MRTMLIAAAFATVLTGGVLAHAEDLPLWRLAYADCVARHDPGCLVEPSAAYFVHEKALMPAELQGVDRVVNSSMRADTDLDVYKMPDYWISGQKRGDCEDFQLTKRVRLMALGFPANALRIAIVAPWKRKSDEVHAILLVYTDKRPRDPYILDNLNPLVYRVSSPFARQYQFLYVQDGRGGWTKWPQAEESINDALVATSAGK